MRRNRIQKIRAEMEKEGLDALLVSSVPNIAYLTGYSNFSQIEREAYILLTRNRIFLFTDGRYTEAIKAQVPFIALVEISSRSPFTSHLKNVIRTHKIKSLGVEKENITLAEYQSIQNTLAKIQIKLKPTQNLIKRVRAVKEPDEIKLIKKACELTDKAFSYIVRHIKIGVVEKEVAFKIEFFIKNHEGDIAFRPIVAFGGNASVPHHQTSEKKLSSKDFFVLLDFGAKIDNYCSDMTRTLIMKNVNSRARKIYEIVFESQKKAIEFLTNQSSIINNQSRYKTIKATEVDLAARNYITSNGYPSIPHGLGHGVGLEVHELPILASKSRGIIKPNMVFTIEPGIYLPGFGGIRIEDTVLFTASGVEPLTKSPKELTEI